MTTRQSERLTELRRAAGYGLLSKIEQAFVESLDDTKAMHPLTAEAFIDLWARSMSRTKAEKDSQS